MTTPSRLGLCLAAAAPGPPRRGPSRRRRPRMPRPRPPGWTNSSPPAGTPTRSSRPPAADDAEFMRRLYLDLAGTIPPVSEVRAFLADTSPDKRRKLIDRLLNSPDYVSHFTNVWASTWLPDGPEIDNIGAARRFRSMAARPARGERRLRPHGPGDSHDRAAPGQRPPGRRRPLGHDAAGRRVARRLLPRLREQAGEAGRRHVAAVPRRAAGVRPVPQPPLRRVDARTVLGVRRLLRRRPDGGNARPSPSPISARSSRPASRTARSRNSRTGPGRASSWRTGRPRRTTSISPAPAVNRVWSQFFGDRPGRAGGRPPARGRTRTKCSTTWPTGSPTTISISNS